MGEKKKNTMSNPKRRKISKIQDKFSCYYSDDEIQGLINDMKNEFDVGIDLKVDVIRLLSDGDIIDFISKEVLSCPKCYQTIYAKLFNNGKRSRSFLKKRIKNAKIPALLGPYILNYENLPRNYERRFDFLMCKLNGVETDVRKRSIEIINSGDIPEPHMIFVDLLGITIPADIMLEILSYVDKTLENLNSVGLVNEKWYILFLRTWSFLNITRKNLMKIPILALRSSPCIRIKTKLLKADVEYLFNEINPISIRIDKPGGIIKYIKRKLWRCQELILGYLDRSVRPIKRSIFPKIRELFIKANELGGYDEMDDKTFKFLRRLDSIRFVDTRIDEYHSHLWANIPTWVSSYGVNDETIQTRVVELFMSQRCEWKSVFESLGKIKTLETLILGFTYNSGSINNTTTDHIVNGIERELPELKNLKLLFIAQSHYIFLRVLPKKGDLFRPFFNSEKIFLIGRLKKLDFLKTLTYEHWMKSDDSMKTYTRSTTKLDNLVFISQDKIEEYFKVTKDVTPGWPTFRIEIIKPLKPQ